MPLDENSLAEVNALSAAATAAKGHASVPLQAEVTTERHEIQPKSYLDKALGVVIKNDAWERNVAEAAKTGAIFFGGKVGVAATIALYGLDQIKVGDSFAEAAVDATLGVAKGTALRGVYAVAAARDFGIAGQTLTLGLGSRALDTGLNRQTWTDSKTKSFSMEQGRATMLQTALDRPALLADLGSFAVGGALSGAVNKFAENSLRSSPLWRTTLTGGAFGLATGSTSEIRREQDSGEKFDITKILSAGGKQAIFSAIAVAPAGMQAGRAVRNGFLDTYGVHTIGEKGSYRYLFRANGEVHEALSSDASVKGLKEAQGRLSFLSGQRQVDLANTFGISFAKAGEPISYRDGSGTVNITARAPRLNELVVMDQVLTKSQPGQLALDGKTGVKFNFLQDKDVGALRADGLYEIQGQTPNIFLHHELVQDKPLTERDRDSMPNDGGKRRHSLEANATHEIAHNSDIKVREADPQLEASIREKLGWVRFRDGTLDFDTHLLKGKDGGLYRFSYANRTWVSSDAQGNPLDMQGNKAQPGSEFRLTNDEMMSNSLVPTATDYFNNPTEMLMEGFKDFRIGGENRAHLFRDNPVLYEQVTLQDDRELALHYGTDPSGRPVMVRLPDGTLAKRDAQSQETIAHFEKESLTKLNGLFGYQY
jgi:hypothetical protein